MTCMGYSLVGLMYHGRQSRMATATYTYRSSDPYISTDTSLGPWSSGQLVTHKTTHPSLRHRVMREYHGFSWW